MKPTIGRIVHYRLPDRYEGDNRWRPAMVVNSFDGTTHNANLTVFLDGLNDVRDANLIESVGLRVGLFLSVGSASEGEKPGNWRWPPVAVIKKDVDIGEGKKADLVAIPVAIPEGPTPGLLEGETPSGFDTSRIMEPSRDAGAGSSDTPAAS